jgi:hypothetical protein
MHRLSKLLSATGLSCMIVLCLSYLANYDVNQTRDESADVMVTLAYGDRLTDDNLVDYMAHLPLSLAIRKVDWREPVLYIDLYVKDGTERNLVFTDIRDICLFGLQSMRNVSKVMMRIYDSPRGSSSLLLAISADSFAKRKLTERLRDAGTDGDAEQLVRSVFQVQETPRWPLLFGES